MQVYGGFGDASVAFANLGDALAAYLKSPEVNPFTSKFDYALKGRAQLDVTEQYGRWLFENKGGCSGCHPDAVGPAGGAPLFTTFGYANAGVPKNPENPFYDMPPAYNPDGERFTDMGLFGVVPDVTEAGKMKIPTLRNVAVTAPYGHNGYFATVRDVIAYHNTSNFGWPQPEISLNKSPLLGNLQLSDVEIDAIVAFLNTLSDGYSLRGVKDPGEPMLSRSARVTPALNIYPNPFNPVTRIDYTVNDASRIRITVYDVAGRRVRTLVDETTPAGAHSTTWNGRDARDARVAAGVYFVRMEMGAQTLIRKAVLTP
jgi:cytochrome c peroxidase